MWTFQERSWTIAAGIVLFVLCDQPSILARGSQVVHDPAWNSEHFDHLPPEVRNAVIRICGHPPSAGHYFATYFDNSRLIKLHFEHLHCDEKVTFCRGASCLHEVYVSVGGHYRLVKSYYGSNND